MFNGALNDAFVMLHEKLDLPSGNAEFGGEPASAEKPVESIPVQIKDVETVARALCKIANLDPDFTDYKQKKQWQEYEDDARKIVIALREEGRLVHLLTGK